MLSTDPDSVPLTVNKEVRLLPPETDALQDVRSDQMRERKQVCSGSEVILCRKNAGPSGQRKAVLLGRLGKECILLSFKVPLLFLLKALWRSNLPAIKLTRNGPNSLIIGLLQSCAASSTVQF